MLGLYLPFNVYLRYTPIKLLKQTSDLQRSRSARITGLQQQAWLWISYLETEEMKSPKEKVLA